MRTIWITLLLASSLIATNTFSMTNHTFVQGLSVEYELPPHDPQIFSNVFFWTVKATCIVISESQDNAISITVVRKSGSVNGIALTTGDTMSLIVHPGEKINISADSGAKVELLNLENITIKANCTTGA